SAHLMFERDDDVPHHEQGQREDLDAVHTIQRASLCSSSAKADCESTPIKSNTVRRIARIRPTIINAASRASASGPGASTASDGQSHSVPTSKSAACHPV